MKFKLFALLLLGLFLVSCSKDKAAEGQNCETNDDCVSGICLDLHEVEDGCNGKVCVATCTDDSTCTLEANPDCEGISGDRRICLYESWEARFCGGN